MLDPQKPHKNENLKVYDAAFELYNELLGIYLGKCNDISDATVGKMDPKYDLLNMTLNAYDYEQQFKKDEESADITSMSQIESDEKKVR